MKIRYHFLDFQLLQGSVATYCRWGGNRLDTSAWTACWRTAIIAGLRPAWLACSERRGWTTAIAASLRPGWTTDGQTTWQTKRKHNAPAAGPQIEWTDLYHSNVHPTRLYSRCRRHRCKSPEYMFGCQRHMWIYSQSVNMAALKITHNPCKQY